MRRAAVCIALLPSLVASAPLVLLAAARPAHAQDPAGQGEAPVAENRWWEQPPPGQGPDAPPPSPTPGPTPAPTPAPTSPAAPRPGFPPGTGGAVNLDTPGAEPSSFKWRWKQVLAHTRLGGRLTAVAVDPQNPERIYVGTEEATLLKSSDGGLTWREIEVRPFVFQDRQVRPDFPGLPKLGTPTPLGLTFFLDPPFRERPPDRLAAPFDTLFFDIKPEFMSILFTPNMTPLATNLLDIAVKSRRYITNPVERIQVCPGAEFPLLMATNTTVLGSQDEGLTWVRLFRLPGRLNVSHVVCSPWNPKDVVIASGFGMFRSTDGGITFDQDMSGWPGREFTAVGYGPPKPDGSPRVYAATGDIMFAGDPKADEGLRMVYPDFNNSSTAPWLPIWWVDTSEDGDVWLATDDGLRRSRDHGENWENAAPSLFSRQHVWQVEIGPNEDGGERIAVMVRDCPVTPRPGEALMCRHSYVYASDDDGETWIPFFHGVTRRNHAQIEAAPTVPGVPPRWWVVTGGELWATVGPETQDVTGRILRDEARWARDRLERTPPVGEVIERTLDRTGLSPKAETEMLDRLKRRNLLPVVNAQLFAGNVLHPGRGADFDIDDNPLPGRLPGTFDVAANRTERAPEGGAFPTRQFGMELDRHIWFFFVQATWVLPDTHVVTEEMSPTRNAMHELRRQVFFITEDAWHERVIHLRRIARGMSDPMEVAILRERVAALEAVMEVWMREPLMAGAYDDERREETR